MELTIERRREQETLRRFDRAPAAAMATGRAEARK